MSKHIITNAINEKELNVIWIGNKRYFRLSDIESFLEEKSQNNINSNSSIIESWRNFNSTKE